MQDIIDTALLEAHGLIYVADLDFAFHHLRKGDEDQVWVKGDERDENSLPCLDGDVLTFVTTDVESFMKNLVEGFAP